MPRRRKYPEIEVLSEAERQELENEVLESRIRYRGSTLEDVVNAALAYHAEKERRDPAHKARLSQRKETLRSAIKEAYEAMQPGPVTDLDLAFFKGLRDQPRKS